MFSNLHGKWDGWAVSEGADVAGFDWAVRSRECGFRRMVCLIRIRIRIRGCCALGRYSFYYLCSFCSKSKSFIISYLHVG